MNSPPAASASSLPQLSRAELSLRGTRISPGLASGTIWMAGDILDCSAEAHRIEPHQVDAELERVRRAFAQVAAELEQSARRISEQIDPSLGEIFRAHRLMLESLLSSNEFEKELRGSLTSGDEALVDTFREALIISPSPDTRRAFDHRLEEYRASLLTCKGNCRKPAITRDGQKISIEANLAAHASIETVIENGADGVGLFRIEELYFARELPPSEEELFSELQHLVAPLREKPVTIRLLDAGGDKAIPSLRLPFESNPLLRKRGVLLLLDYPQLARIQLKSLLRLAKIQDIRILVPMVSLERDMQQMRELLVAR